MVTPEPRFPAAPRLLGPLPRAAGARERGDGPAPLPDLGGYLDDLERLNAWFGGYALTLRAIDRLVRGQSREGARGRPEHPEAARRIVADVGGARGDLAARIVRRARRRGTRIRVIVLDRDEAAVAHGRRAMHGHPEIVWIQADAGDLPLRPQGVDVAAMTLTLHHLEPEPAAAALAEMRRVARLGVVVNDLARTRMARWFVVMATRLFARHPASRHDGPLSVLRAYGPGELRALAHRAGFTRLSIRRYPLLARLLMVGS